MLLYAAVAGFLAATAYPTLHGTDAAKYRAGLTLLPPGWTAGPQASHDEGSFARHPDTERLDAIRPVRGSAALTVDLVESTARSHGWTVVSAGETEVELSKPALEADVGVSAAAPASLDISVTAESRGRLLRGGVGALTAVAVAAVALEVSRRVTGSVRDRSAVLTLTGVLLGGLTTWAPLLPFVARGHVPLADPGFVRLLIGGVGGLLLGLYTSPGGRRRLPRGRSGPTQ